MKSKSFKLGGKPVALNRDSSRTDLRFDWFAQRIQHILNLARLLPDCIQRTWIGHGIAPARSTESILAAQIVARGASNVSHDETVTAASPVV
jgi:hypothetical protein